MSFFRKNTLKFLLFFAFLGCVGADEKIILGKDTKNKYLRQLSLINTAVRTHPDRAVYYYKRAQFFFDHKKFNQSILDIETALKLNARLPHFHYLYAKVLKAKNKDAAALNALEKAFELGFADFPSAVLAAELCYRRGQAQKASQYLEIAETYRHPLPKIDHYKARLALDRGDTATAFPLLFDAIGKDSADKKSWLALADYHEKNQKTEKSVQILAQASRHLPLDAAYLYRIAATCDSLYGLDSAVFWYKKAAQYPEANFETNYRCAQYYIKQKAHTQAVSYYKKALLQQPDFAFGHYQLAYLFEQEKDTANALAHYKKAVALEKEPEYLRRLQNLQNN